MLIFKWWCPLLYPFEPWYWKKLILNKRNEIYFRKNKVSDDYLNRKLKQNIV